MLQYVTLRTLPGIAWYEKMQVAAGEFSKFLQKHMKTVTLR